MGELLVAVLGGGAAGLILWGIWALNREILSEGEEAFGEKPQEKLGPLFHLLLPYARSVAALILKIRPEPGRLRREIARRIRLAGSPGEITAEELIGLSVVTGGVFFLLLALMAAGLELKGSLRYGVVIGGVLLGLALPWIWIADRVRSRQGSIRKQLPFAMDLMTLGVEAGLDFTVALSRIVEGMRGTPLGEEFGRLLREIRMGRSRKEALRSLQQRTSLMEVDFFVSALVQADELGVGLGQTLRVQADGMRQKRFQRAEELAMKAPVKIVFPLVAFIMPTTLVVVLGPLAIQLWRQFGTS